MDDKTQEVNILFIGDVVGRPGRELLLSELPGLQSYYQAELVVVNGENLAGGVGLTPPLARELLDNGVDVLTSGNHIWDKREIIDYMSLEPRILRPANYPPGAPGRGWTVVEGRNSVPVAVGNLSGRLFMEPLDCPFQAAERWLSQGDMPPLVVVDVHAEATSEKQALGWYMDGRVTAVIGTHTHVQTSDARLLDHGTGYLTDVGMTGPRDGILGVQREAVIRRFEQRLPERFKVASGPSVVEGVAIAADPVSGVCTALKPFRIGEST